MMYVSSNNLRQPATKTFTPPHYTSPNYTSLHATISNHPIKLKV